MVKCVVTGGNGFIGSHVVAELLAQGADVAIYDTARDPTARARVIQDDIRNYETLARCLTETDYVFHLSGVLGTSELFDAPKTAIEINVIGALNVLEAIRLNKGTTARILFPSKPNEWNNVYSATAQAVEKLGHAYRETFGIDVRILKLPNVYGPRQRASPVRKAVPAFIIQALHNRPIDIFGDGTQSVELVYVQDAAKSIVDYMNTDTVPSETYELISNHRITVNELADRIINTIGSRSKKAYFPQRRGESGGVTTARARNLEEFLGPQSSIALDTGMQMTVAWYRNAVKLPRHFVLTATSKD